MKSYILDTSLACTYGVDEAIFLQTLGYWIEKNHLNGVNRVAGRTWTYNSMAALEGMFPFWTRRVLQRIVGKLTEAGALFTAQHSKESRVTWYALNDEILDALGLSECRSDPDAAAEVAEEALPDTAEAAENATAPNGAMPDSTARNGAMHCTKRCNDICNNIITANTPLSPPTGGERAKTKYPEDFERFWAAYPRKVDKDRAYRAWRRAGLQHCDLPDVMTALARWKMSEQWQDERYIPHPSVWINNRRWESEPPKGGRRADASADPELEEWT